MRWRWVSSVILVVVVGGSFGTVAETATSKPVDLKLGVTGSPGRAVVAGEVLTVRASIQKLTVAGGAATSFKFLYSLSRGLKLVGITTNAGRYDRGSGRVALMQLRPGKPIVITIRLKVLPTASRSVAFSATVAPGAGWRETKAANNAGVRRWTIGPPPKPADLGVTITDGYVTILRGSPNTYTVTATNRGPTTVSRLRLRVVTRLAAPTYDFAAGAYDPASGTWSEALARAWTTRHADRLRYRAELNRNADGDRRDLARCRRRGPCVRKQQVDRQDHHRHPLTGALGETSAEPLGCATPSGGLSRADSSCYRRLPPSFPRNAQHTPATSDVPPSPPTPTTIER